MVSADPTKGRKRNIIAKQRECRSGGELPCSPPSFFAYAMVGKKFLFLCRAYGTLLACPAPIVRTKQTLCQSKGIGKNNIVRIPNYHSNYHAKPNKRIRKYMPMRNIPRSVFLRERDSVAFGTTFARGGYFVPVRKPNLPLGRGPSQTHGGLFLKVIVRFPHP